MLYIIRIIFRLAAGGGLGNRVGRSLRATVIPIVSVATFYVRVRPVLSGWMLVQSNVESGCTSTHSGSGVAIAFLIPFPGNLHSVARCSRV